MLKNEMPRGAICWCNIIISFPNLHWQTRSHAERGESLQNQDFVGGMQKRRRFAAAPLGFRKQNPNFCGPYCTKFECILKAIPTTDCHARSAWWLEPAKHAPIALESRLPPSTAAIPKEKHSLHF